ALTVPTAKASIQKNSSPCTNNGHLLNNGANKTTESVRDLMASSAIQHPSPTPSLSSSSQQPPQQQQLLFPVAHLHTEVVPGQPYEGDLTVKVMTNSGTISVSRVHLTDKIHHNSIVNNSRHSHHRTPFRHVSL
ncbi:hypothetical protein DAPPUDRAFT_99029, partial [Daphnia pulex]